MVSKDLSDLLAQGMDAEEMRALASGDHPLAKDFFAYMTEMEREKASLPSPRVVTTSKLRSLVARAEKAGLNRVPTDEFCDRLDPHGRHVLTPLIEHVFADKAPHRKHYRVQVQAKVRGSMDPETAILDVYPEVFERLPEVRAQRKSRPDPKWEEVSALQAEALEGFRRVELKRSRLTNDGSVADEHYSLSAIGRDMTGPGYYVSNDVLALVEHAAPSMPSEHALSMSDPYTPTGFAILESPVFMDAPVVDGQVIEFPLRAFSWTTLPSGSGFAVIWYADRFDEMVPERLVELATEDGWTARLLPIWASSVGEGWTIAEDVTPATSVYRFLFAFWLISQQQITLVTGRKPVRGLRRTAERMGLPSTINVVTLRRALHAQPEGGEPQEVQWSHRWVVSGHWRRYWSEKAQEIRTTWVSPYVKGPEDKPLIVKERFYRFTR